VQDGQEDALIPHDLGTSKPCESAPLVVLGQPPLTLPSSPPFESSGSAYAAPQRPESALL
jgi:hypothetical protein